MANVEILKIGLGQLFKSSRQAVYVLLLGTDPLLERDDSDRSSQVGPELRTLHKSMNLFAGLCRSPCLGLNQDYNSPFPPFVRSD